jgi:hypothetical protein
MMYCTVSSNSWLGQTLPRGPVYIIFVAFYFSVIPDLCYYYFTSNFGFQISQRLSKNLFSLPNSCLYYYHTINVLLSSRISSLMALQNIFLQVLDVYFVWIFHFIPSNLPYTYWSLILVYLLCPFFVAFKSI